MSHDVTLWYGEAPCEKCGAKVVESSKTWRCSKCGRHGRFVAGRREEEMEDLE